MVVDVEVHVFGPLMLLRNVYRAFDGHHFRMLQLRSTDELPLTPPSPHLSTAVAPTSSLPYIPPLSSPLDVFLVTPSCPLPSCALCLLLSPLGSSSATLRCGGALSKRKTPFASGCTLSKMSIAISVCGIRLSLVKYPSFCVSNIKRAWLSPSHKYPATSSMKSDTMMDDPRDFCRKTFV